MNIAGVNMASFFGKRNMGLIDRTIRIVTGLVMMYFGFIDQSVIGNLTVSIIIGIFGIISILFAYMAFCPIYTFGNISTIKKPADNG